MILIVLGYRRWSWAASAVMSITWRWSLAGAGDDVAVLSRQPSGSDGLSHPASDAPAKVFA